MDELQDRLVRVGLAALTEHGFALALQAHGLIDRLSEDVDLFTDRWDKAEFSRAVDSVVEAYRHAGLDVIVARRAETFARLEATEPTTGRAGAVDRPVTLSIGPVLAEADAVASKVAAVFSRGYARDYLDLAGILASGHYSRDQLMAMASKVDAGFTTGWFAEALAAVDRFSDDDFSRYGFNPDQIVSVREVMRSWSAEFQEQTDMTPPDGDVPRSSPAARARRIATSRATRAPSRSPWSDPHATPDSGYQTPTPEGPSL